MEKIYISNFGGLKDIEFEFKKINILIGPQASGKSITVKLTYFFKEYFSSIFKCIQDGDSKRELDNKQKEKFYTYFPKETWGKDDFFIRYELNDSFIIVKRAGTLSINIEYSDKILKSIKKARKFINDEFKKHSEEKNLFYRRNNAREKFYECVNADVGVLAAYNQFFIPAGRSFFANLQSGIFSFLSSNRQLDPFLIEFGSFYETFKTFSINNNSRKRSPWDLIVSDIINGEYFREKDKDFLIHKDKRKVNLANASSGQQETLPLLLVLKVLSTASFSHGATLYIEEPEAHLFPSAQKKIVQLLARTFNLRENSLQLIITTHSPYIVSSFNNLLEAGKIISDNPDLSKKVYDVVPKDEVLQPEALVAYSVKNGEKELIIDNFTELISQNILDGVSDEISEEFGKLLDIE